MLQRHHLRLIFSFSDHLHRHIVVQLHSVLLSLHSLKQSPHTILLYTLIRFRFFLAVPAQHLKYPVRHLRSVYSPWKNSAFGFELHLLVIRSIITRPVQLPDKLQPIVQDILFCMFSFVSIPSYFFYSHIRLLYLYYKLFSFKCQYFFLI